MIAALLLATMLVMLAQPVLAARYSSPGQVGPVPANGVLRVYLKAMSAFGPHRLHFTNTRTGAFSSVSTPGGPYGLVGLATTLNVVAGDSVRIEMFNDNMGGFLAPGYDDPVAAWKCNGGDDFGDLYGMAAAAAAGAPIIAVQCWEDWADNDYNDVALVVSYEPATVSTNTLTPTSTATPTASQTPTATLTPTSTATATPSQTPTPIRADLAVSVSNGTNAVTAGTGTTYTVVASNAGPNTVSGAPISITFSDELAGVVWTCTATNGACGQMSGAGNVSAALALNPGGSATFTIDATVRPEAVGSAAVTASINTAGGVVEANPADNNAADVDAIQIVADLSLSKSNGASAVIPGTATTYTIVMSNAGPSRAVNVPVADALAGSLGAAFWTCSAAGGACSSDGGAGDLNTMVTLDPGGAATFSITALVRAEAIGTLSNSASLNLPPGVVDPTGGDHLATDTDVLTPQADLSVSLTNGANALIPGLNTTYTLVVVNHGPSAVDGALVTDALPAQITDASWQCAATNGACTGAVGTGDIRSAVSLDPGGSATFTVTGTVAASAIGALTNSPSVEAPAGLTDPDPSNNTAADADPLTPQADISVSKSASPASLAPGQWVTYTITAHNAGPSDALAVTVVDSLPADLTGATWTCAASAGSSCAAANGSGRINAPTHLLANGSATLTLSARVRSTATDVVHNVATASVDQAVIDPNPANNDSGDVPIMLFPQAGVAIAKSNGASAVTPGLPVTYTIVVYNSGPSAATNVRVSDVVPILLDKAHWTCSATAGSRCAAPGGSGDIDTVVDLLDEGEATFSITGEVPPDAHLTASVITNTARFTAPAGVLVPPGFDVSADADPLAPLADLAVTIASDVIPGAPPGTPITQQLTLINHGPSVATNVRLIYTFPSEAEITGLPNSCGLVGNTLTCGWSLMQIADPHQVTVVIRHNDEGILTTSAAVLSDVPDPVMTDNSATTTSFTGPCPTVLPTLLPTITAVMPTATTITQGRTTAMPSATATSPAPTAAPPSPTPSPTVTVQPSRTPRPIVVMPPPQAPVSNRAGWLWLYGAFTLAFGLALFGTTAYLRDPRPAVLHRIHRLATAEQRRRSRNIGEL